MLFNAEYCEEDCSGHNKTNKNNKNENFRGVNEPPHWTMFNAASPSPTRTMIKEANDHLQLLHQKVTELEKTVREQAEALIKKDELMQTRLKELADMKDARIMELSRGLEIYEQRIQKLEQSCKEKESVIEMMNHRCGFVEELVSYTPLLEGLVSSLKGLPRRTSINADGGGGGDHHSAVDVVPSVNKPSTRRTSNRGSRQLDRHNHQRAMGNNLMVQVNTEHSEKNAAAAQMQMQAATDMKMGRSFNINRNFSMSEDEDVI